MHMFSHFLICPHSTVWSYFFLLALKFHTKCMKTSQIKLGRVVSLIRSYSLVTCGGSVSDWICVCDENCIYFCTVRKKFFWNAGRVFNELQIGLSGFLLVADNLILVLLPQYSQLTLLKLIILQWVATERQFFCFKRNTSVNFFS